jgi:hypothetical protein
MKMIQFGRSLSKSEQKAVVGGKTCPSDAPKYCFIYGNPNPEYPDVQLRCNSCDDWSGMAGDQCREVCGAIGTIPILE